jgi:hypothetical protein
VSSRAQAPGQAAAGAALAAEAAAPAPAPASPDAAEAAEAAPAPASVAAEAAGTVEAIVWRNLMAGAASRPETRLAPGATVSLAGERIRVAGIARLRIAATDPGVKAALHFRRDPAAQGVPPDLAGAERWSLTVILVARPRPHDYLYLAEGEGVRDGKFAPQPDYRVGQGLETELNPGGGSVAEIVIQDEGDTELRLRQAGDTLVLTAVTPRAGGHPTSPSRPWYRDEPLRFQHDQLLLGGYAKAVFDNDYAGWLLPSSTPEHAFLEANVGDAAGVRAAAFTKPRESFAVEQLVFMLQTVRGEWWSLWAEAGASAFQRTLSPAHAPGTTRSGAGWTAGAAAHARFGDWGGEVRWADTDGPSLTQVLAGWQAARHFGVALSWISYRSVSATGLALSFGF